MRRLQMTPDGKTSAFCFKRTHPMHSPRLATAVSATVATAAKVPAELNGQVRVRLPIVGRSGPRNGERVQATIYDAIDGWTGLTFHRSANDEDRVSLLAACLAENST